MKGGIGRKWVAGGRAALPHPDWAAGRSSSERHPEHFVRPQSARTQADVQIRVNLMGKRLFDVYLNSAFVQDDCFTVGARILAHYALGARLPRAYSCICACISALLS